MTELGKPRAERHGCYDPVRMNCGFRFAHLRMCVCTNCINLAENWQNNWKIKLVWLREALKVMKRGGRLGFIE